MEKKQKEIIEISEPFYIEKKGIEYISGLDYKDGDFYIGYGIDDNVAKVSKVKF